MECWSIGVMEYWVFPNPLLHHSITPLFQPAFHAFVARSLSTSFALSGLEIILYL